MGYLQSGFRSKLVKMNHPAIRKQKAAMRAKNKALKEAANKVRKKGIKVTAKQKAARRKNIKIARLKKKKK